MNIAENVKSRRGVYYELTKSPYEFKSPYGDLFKFPSEKKLEIYVRDVKKEIERVNKVIERYNLRERIPVEIVNLVLREVYRSFYENVVR